LKRHAFDPVSFLAGVALAGVGIAILTESLTLLEANAEWLLPVFAVALGAAVLFATPRADTPRADTPRADKDTPPAEPVELAREPDEDRDAFAPPSAASSSAGEPVADHERL
jgi:hypothetical protein